MGFLDALFGKKETNCPRCGTKGARRSGARILCSNLSCPNFDASLRGGAPDSNQSSSQGYSGRKGSYVAAKPVTVRYRNFRGEDKTFTVEADSIRRRKDHLMAAVEPTGEHLSLSRSRIQNLQEVESNMPATESRGDIPPAKARQVIAYHKKHGTTSPLYEQMRAKYPNW